MGSVRVFPGHFKLCSKLQPTATQRTKFSLFHLVVYLLSWILVIVGGQPFPDRKSPNWAVRSGDCPGIV